MATQAVHNVIGAFGTDGDWGNNANWGGDTAVEPVDGDEVLLRGSSQSITAGLDNNLIDLDQLTVAPTFTGSIGSSGSPLIIDCTGAAGSGPGRLTYAGGGSEAWFSGDFTEVIARHKTFGDNAFNILGQGSAVDQIWCMDGKTTLNGSGTYTIVDTAPNATESTRVVIEAGATLVTINCHAGTIENNSADVVTTCNIYGGEYQQLTDLASTDIITTLNVYGGRFSWQADTEITTINQYGGVIDTSKTDKDKLVTNYNGFAGVLDLRTNGTVTMTNRNFFGPVQVLPGTSGISV